MAKQIKDTEWREAAHKALETLARTNSMIVSDMVVAALEEAGLGLANYSALGGVFTRAAKDGLIIKTDETKQSTRARSNSAKTVWRSLVYNAPGATKEVNTLTNLLMSALDFNATTVRLASLLVAGGPIDQKTYTRAIKDFNGMSDQYQARIAKLLEDFENDARNAAGMEELPHER